MKNRMESDYNIDYELKMINGLLKNCFVNHTIHGYNYYQSNYNSANNEYYM